MTFVQKTLDNGLRICLEPFDHVQSAACGFLVLTGSRDESPECEGVSHFLEHMCFKGTSKSSCEQINKRFDALGSQYNAFTSQEKTMYYGWVPAEQLSAQIDLLAEIMRSTIPQQEFDTEKNVILEEIAMYRDNLYSSAVELAHKSLFAGTPLAQSILGTNETIGELTRAQMVAYHAARYGPENLVFVGTGRLDPVRVCDQLQQLTRDWAPASGGRNQSVPVAKQGVAKLQNDKFSQQALLLCYPAPAASADDARARVLPAILGGDNSRIFWNVIQQGVCHDAGMFYMGYVDVGLFVLYAACEPSRADVAVSALREQAQRISDVGAEPVEVTRVCNNMRTKMAHDGDSPMKRIVQLAGNLQMLGRPRALADQLAQIEALTADDVTALLREYPITGEGLLVSVGPADWP